MNTFSPLGFDINFSFGQQSVFSVVETQWQAINGLVLDMITENGVSMITDITQNQMITE